MVRVAFDAPFKKSLSKIKDSFSKKRVLKKIEKIAESPEIGKPMRYERKNTREVYIGSFRLAYLYEIENDKVVILDLYHKDEQ